MLESGADTAALWDRLIRYQLVGEGEGETTLHTAPARPRRSLDRPFVWGIGAELGRAFYYRHGDTLHPASAVRAFWETVADGGRLVDPLAAHDLLVPLARGLRSSMDDAGVTGLHQLDHFYVFQRVRRLQNRLGTTSGLRPYFAVPYARATLGRPPAERVRMTFHEALVARAYPAWAGIPYSHERGRSRSSTATPQSYAEVFWESPYAARLHADVMDAIRAHPFVHRGEARRLLELGGRRDGLSVQRMRDLNRLLDLVSFDRHRDRRTRRSSPPAAWRFGACRAAASDIRGRRSRPHRGGAHPGRREGAALAAFDGAGSDRTASRAAFVAVVRPARHAPGARPPALRVGPGTRARRTRSTIGTCTIPDPRERGGRSPRVTATTGRGSSVGGVAGAFLAAVLVSGLVVACGGTSLATPHERLKPLRPTPTPWAPRTIPISPTIGAAASAAPAAPPAPTRWQEVSPLIEGARKASPGRASRRSVMVEPSPRIR